MERSNNVVEIIKNSDTDAIKNLIVTQNPHISHGLRLICIEGSRPDDLEKRKLINKNFMTCLIQVKGRLPLALSWLKNHVDADICDCIISDYDFCHTCLQILKKRFVVTKKRVEMSLSKAVDENCGCLMTSWIKVSFNRLMRFLTIAMAYLDLSFDSVLLGTILYFTRDTLDDYERFSTQIVIILLLSILIPAMITAVTIGSQQPLVLIGPDQWINLKTVID
jgi:Na+/melibiose symporter-like transporter